MKIPIKKIKDQEIEVTVNNGTNRIEQIKAELQQCFPQTGFCKIEVFNMWNEE